MCSQYEAAQKAYLEQYAAYQQQYAAYQQQHAALGQYARAAESEVRNDYFSIPPEYRSQFFPEAEEGSAQVTSDTLPQANALSDSTDA